MFFMLGMFVWVKFLFCIYFFYVCCVINYLRVVFLRCDELFEEFEFVKCFICKNKIEFKDDWWDWIFEGCYVWLVIFLEFEIFFIICEESLEMYLECIFVVLWGRFLLERDKEFDGYLMGFNDIMESVEFECSFEVEGMRGIVCGFDG